MALHALPHAYFSENLRLTKSSLGEFDVPGNVDVRFRATIILLYVPKQFGFVTTISQVMSTYCSGQQSYSLLFLDSLVWLIQSPK